MFSRQAASSSWKVTTALRSEICPHGRPIVKRLSLVGLLREFGRLYISISENHSSPRLAGSGPGSLSWGPIDRRRSPTRACLSSTGPVR
jgi:hypothetical protein